MYHRDSIRIVGLTPYSPEQPQARQATRDELKRQQAGAKNGAPGGAPPGEGRNVAEPSGTAVGRLPRTSQPPARPRAACPPAARPLPARCWIGKGSQATADPIGAQGRRRGATEIGTGGAPPRRPRWSVVRQGRGRWRGGGRLFRCQAHHREQKPRRVRVAESLAPSPPFSGNRSMSSTGTPPRKGGR